MQALQIKPILAPRGGIRKTLPADLISDLDMSDAQNVFFEAGLVKKRYGMVQKGANLPLAGPVIGSDQFYKFDGNNWLITLTTKLAYYFISAITAAATKAGITWETLNENEVEDNCETTWTDDMGANGAVADETTIKKVGATSQKISPAAGFTTGLMAHRAQSLGDKSAYSFVRLWIRSSIAMDANDLQFLIDNTAGCTSPTETLNIPALVADEWKLVFLECSDPASNMTSIESLGLKAAVDKGACDIYIDDIQFVKSFDSTVAYDTSSEDMFSYDYVRKSTESDPWWVCTNGVDPIKYFTGSGSLTNLISSYPSGVTALLCKHVVEFKDHLILLDVSEGGNRYPQRIRWSDTADPEDFLNGNASSQDLTGSDWIQAAIKFKGDYLVILKERSIWVGFATGDSDIFQFNQKSTGAGCAAPKTVESLGDEIIFLGWDDVYAFDGIDYSSLTEDTIGLELINSINPQQIGKCFGVVVEEQREYWLFYPSIGSDYCDAAWVFNYDLNKWTKHAFSKDMTIFGYHQLESTVTIADLVGTIAEQNWRIGDRTTLQAMPTTFFGTRDGYILEYDTSVNNDDGTLIDGFFDTKDFNPTHFMQQFFVSRLDVYFTGNMKVYYSTDKGISWTLAATLSSSYLDTVNRLYLKVDCNQIRWRIRDAVAGQHFEFSRMNMYYRPSGRRLV